MMDLLYCEEADIYEEAKALLKKKFPHSRIEDGSDDIHPYRFQFYLPDVSDDKQKIEQEKDYFRYLLEEGIFNLSFHFQLATMDKSNPYYNMLLDLIHEVVEKQKAAKTIADKAVSNVATKNKLKEKENETDGQEQQTN